MEKSQSIGNIAKALLVFHQNVAKVKKDSNNPFFKSKYAGLPNVLESIEEPLQKAGISFVQFPCGSSGLTTVIMHGESGEWMQDTYEMEPTKKDPQSIGSCITYMRRYALAAILGLNIDEDDDGNSASQPQNKAKQEPKTYTAAPLPELVRTHEMWKKVTDSLMKGTADMAYVKSKFTVSPLVEKELLTIIEKAKEATK
jgi:ERF superfamily